jgi:hypothetical protein
MKCRNGHQPDTPRKTISQGTTIYYTCQLSARQWAVSVVNRSRLALFLLNRFIVAYAMGRHCLPSYAFRYAPGYAHQVRIGSAIGAQFMAKQPWLRHWLRDGLSGCRFAATSMPTFTCEGFRSCRNCGCPDMSGHQSVRAVRRRMRRCSPGH